MKESGNTILITGGATGIGLALAKRFSDLGNTVIICGRRQGKLEEAAKKIPGLHTLRCDISNAEDRQALHDCIASDFKDLNVLVNNAGIQRRIDFTKGVEDLLHTDDEIEINLKSQIYLTALFIPLLSERKEAAIINVSSGLGIVPLAVFPIYSATKAAVHSLTMSLRHQLKTTTIRVFEVIPPTVHDTGLKGMPMEKTKWSISSAEMADVVISGLKADRYEIAAGGSALWASASRADLDRYFDDINGR
jgi:uncharacterized oxidoreductase